MTQNNQKTFLGHPIGLYTLFFTEMWERFSFYGMKALLMLYMVEYLIWEQRDASGVFKWYTTLVYLTPVMGGLVADHLIGARRSVAIGCVLITIGHSLLAFEALSFFYAGLAFIIIGVGFLKANVSTQVGSMYAPDDPRRDSAFTIFYMGINAGAFMGPLVCGTLRVAYGWHYGFAAAGVGMFLGLIVYLIGQRWVIEVDQDVDLEASKENHVEHHIPKTATRDRIVALVICCLFAGVFFMCFEQMANAMLRWANDNTNLQPFHIQAPEATLEGVAPAAAESTSTWRDWTMPAEWTQSINPFFIIGLGPLFAWLWIMLARRNRQPSSPAKMVIGLLLVGLAFGVMMWASKYENKPVSAPLASLPADIDLSDYGATRLRYDSESALMEMSGVLSQLDRLKLLAESAPDTYEQAVDDLCDRMNEKLASVGEGDPVDVSMELPSELQELSFAALLPDSVRWDNQTRTLTAEARIHERDKLQIIAAAAEPQFLQAVNSIYTQSSLVRLTVWWLVVHFMLATMGELCVSPVGLSLVTKLAPPKHVGLFMGLWFVTTGSMANYFAHLVGGDWGAMTPLDYFTIFAVISSVSTVLLMLLLRFIKNRMHGVH